MLFLLIVGSSFPVIPGLHVAVVTAVSFCIWIHWSLLDSIVGQYNVRCFQKLHAFFFTVAA